MFCDFISVPVFGEELGWQFKPEKNPAPAVVMKCAKAIEERGLHTEDIYAITPPGSHKKALRAALNQGLYRGRFYMYLSLSLLDLIRKLSVVLSIKVCTRGDFPSILHESHKRALRAALSEGLYRGRFYLYPPRMS